MLASCLQPTPHENILYLFIVFAVMLAAVLCQLIFVPRFARRAIRALSIKSLRQFDWISKELFACLIEQAYIDNLYLFEKRVHVRKKRFIHTINKWRYLAHMVEMPTYLEKVDALFDVLMDCAQLRRRVSDHTVFALCKQELAAISNEINKLTVEMILVIKKKKDIIDTLPFSEKIQRFEDNFQHVVMITSREPLAFVLFVASLKGLRDIIDRF